MHLLIIAATPFEVAPLEQYLTKTFETELPTVYKKEELTVQVLVTGVGLFQTSYHLAKVLPLVEPDLVINAGIAGAFNRSLKIGDVVNVVSERFADLGVEEADGSFTDVHEMGLIDPNQHPFKNSILENPTASQFDFLPKASAISVNKVHGTEKSIEAIQQKYKADVESMEGAAFFHACLLEEVPFLEIRSISNYVEKRNRENWNLPLAIESLNKVLIEMTQSFIPVKK